ncbi:MAG: ribose-phosphate pyrophosphokinase [SAR202 cluster bacterium]|jgi:ribose-phosphate pyrophosphokinase|nr:MAG: ribose-phosphate pyrophosphokinase [SAR202 cluster bacterium]MEC7733121.1 ribose-phosphate pyrophosphokinase [Chloroflexota bacterium]KAA1304558.1 MAG: ribose-phosphate pyrophosphokinase [SAR202 cluster bacterium]MEC8987554.1 ribose-phosphate pyrophosphokinase [Chloroflexota bacterium]MED5409643.1 ribose-phosphate pyrophosphokinase [Chloroflexota bacterium]|tara:strand:+ start:446 stop:1396 length:951 start_codon:yes stop_codon:yes gene_type:complete
MPSFEDLRIFSGNSHPKLASDICDYLRIPLGECDVFKFSNDNTFVSFKENVRERDVFLVQTFCQPVNDHIMELLVMIDAAKRASAGRITAVIPHYSYGRSDKKDQPRVPITARLVANLLTVAGADRVLTVDLHAGQIQGFFNIPVDELSAVQMLAGHFKANNIGIEVASATDAGDVKRTRDTARFLNVGMSLVEKHRIGNEDRVEAVSLIGDVKDKTALIVDDELGTGGTVIATAQALKEHGAKDIYCAVTHPVLSGEASNILARSEVIETVVTDTLPVPDAKRGSNLTVLSIAPMLGEAIHRIHSGLSVGAMFEA